MSKRTAVLAAVLGGALTLGGCAGLQTDRAATINGRVLSEDAARTAADQIRQNFPEEAAQFTTGQAVGTLINAPFIIAAAEKAGHPVSEQAARAALTQVGDPSAETIELMRSQMASQWIQDNQDQGAVDDFLASVRTAKISLNPRYGTFDREQVQVVPAAANWILPQAPADPQLGDTPPGG